MRLTRSPVELVRARTMPVWPLWVLVIVTPVLHLLWLAEFHGISEISWNETRIEYESTESQTIAQAFWPEILASAVALGVWGWYHFTRRDVNRASLAGDGWTYRRVPMPAHPGRFTAFPRPRKRGSSISHVAWGPWDDGLYSSYTLWTSKVHRYSVERVELPADLAGVVVVPLGWHDRVSQALEFAPFQVESADFNARWRVVTADARVASAVLHPRMIERFLSGAVPDGVGVTIDDGALLVWSPGRAAPSELEGRLLVAKELAALVPGFVYGQLGTPRPDAWGPWSMRAWLGSGEAAESVAREDARRADARARAERELAAANVGPAAQAMVFNSPAWKAELDQPGLIRQARLGIGWVVGGAVAAVFTLGCGLWPVTIAGAAAAVYGWTTSYRAVQDLASAAGVEVREAWRWVNPGPKRGARPG